MGWKRMMAGVLAGMVCWVAVGAGAQEPADQDKTGQGARGHKKPLADAAGTAVTGAGSGGGGAGAAGTSAGGKAGGKKEAAEGGGDEEAPAAGRGGRGGGGRGGAGGAPEKVAYDYELPGADGKGVPLSSYKGKVLLVVNLARNSSYSTQVAGLEKLQAQYKDKGLVVIGVPSNDFGAAEPGTDAEIQKVYKVQDKVTFPVMALSPLAGTNELPFYLYLTKEKAVPENGPVHWNYTKFLVDKNGKVVARFEADVAPDSPEMLATLEQVLSGKFKPKRAGGGAGEGGGPPGGSEPPM